MNIIDISTYLATMAALYFYTQKQDSIGFFWLVAYVLGEWLIEKIGIATTPASLITGTSLWLTFEISRRFWEEPFSEANIFHAIWGLFKATEKVLGWFGIKPKTNFVNLEHDPLVIQIEHYLKTSDWDAAEHAINALDGDTRYWVLDVIADKKGLPKVFTLWRNVAQDRPLPYIVSGLHAIHWAWEARGSGTANTVTQKGIQLFFQRLLTAQALFEKAISLDDSYAEAYIGQIVIAMGTGFERNQLWALFAKALMRTPDHFNAHSQMINALAEKWGGEPGEAFIVAHKAFARAPAGSPLTCLVAMAHLEHWLYLGMQDLDEEAEQYFTLPDVRQDLEQTYARLIQAKTDNHEYIEALNIFAFCFYLAKHYGLAKDAVAKLDGRFLTYPWQYSSESLLSHINTGYGIDSILRKLDTEDGEEFTTDPDSESYDTFLQDLNAFPEDRHTQVILHDDPINSFSYVRKVMQEIYGYDKTKIFWLLLKVSVSSRHPIWEGQLKEAKLKAQAMLEKGADPTMISKGAKPLKITVKVMNSS